MHLDELTELALRHVSLRNSRPQLVRPIEGLVVLRQAEPSPLEASMYEPVLCLILQGRKQVSIGERTLSFGPGECLLVTHDVPVSSRVTKAPYVALVLTIDLTVIRKLYDEIAESVQTGERADSAVTHRAANSLLDALRRYLALADSPAEARVLGPLVRKELHYRLLVAPFAGMLRRLIFHDSHASAIARATGQIRLELRSAISIPKLARHVGMSNSAFHKHFKAITRTTPLQYQKDLRLLEARRLLQQGSMSVTDAAFEVGYESASQFSREYARKFGVPPSRDGTAQPSAAASRPTSARAARKA